MFLLKMLSRTHRADLCMEHNGGDPSVFVSAVESHEDIGVSPVSGIFSVISLVSDF